MESSLFSIGHFFLNCDLFAKNITTSITITTAMMHITAATIPPTIAPPEDPDPSPSPPTTVTIEICVINITHYCKTSNHQ